MPPHLWLTLDIGALKMKPVSDFETSTPITHCIDILSQENEALTCLSECMRYLRKIPYVVEDVTSGCSDFGGVLEKRSTKLFKINIISSPLIALYLDKDYEEITRSSFQVIFIHSVFCLTTGSKPPPKQFRRIVPSKASSLK
jgi:hypothetical protein